MANIARREPTTRTAGRGESREFPAGQNAPGQLARFRTVVGQILYAPEQPADRLFYLQSGAVEIYRLNRSGQKLIVREVHAAEFFAEIATLVDGSHAGFAEVTAAGEISAIPSTHLAELFARVPEVAHRVIARLASQLRDGEAALIGSAYDRLDTRVANALLSESRRVGGSNLALGQKNLAERVGASRESVTRTLNSLAARGLVELARRRITILDEPKLRALAGGTSS